MAKIIFEFKDDGKSLPFLCAKEDLGDKTEETLTDAEKVFLNYFNAGFIRFGRLFESIPVNSEPTPEEFAVLNKLFGKPQEVAPATLPETSSTQETQNDPIYTTEQ